MKEIAIAGGGLAGLSLGIALADRGVPVRVREAGSYPRHKVCGEFVNGVSDETLSNLRINSIFKNALRHRQTRWWVEAEEVLSAEMESPALGISRWEMDESLRRLLIEKGGQLSVKDRAVAQPAEGLVWTAGRILKKDERWLGLKGHFLGVSLDGLEMHLGDGGYLGLTPVGGGRVNACGLFQQRGLRGKNVIIAYLRESKLAGLADRLEAAEFDQKSLTGVSGFQLGGQDFHPDLLTLGDAERMIPPFTGNGMSMAFEAAECAIDPLQDYAKEECSWADARLEVQSRLDLRFDRRVQLAQKMHHFVTSRVGRGCLKWAARANILPFNWLHRKLT